MPRIWRCLIAALLAISLPGLFAAAPAISANKHPVVNVYHDVRVVDDYQWLENFADPAVQAWSKSQNEAARGYLDQLWVRSAVENRLTSLLNDSSARFVSGKWQAGQLFFLKFEPPAEQAVLVAFTTSTNLNSERVILDPNRLSANGSASIDWFVPSKDGRLVAVSLSQDGSEEGTLYLYDTLTSTARPDVIPGVQRATGGGSAAWNSDGSLLFYTRYPRPGQRPAGDLDFYQQIYVHKTGTPVEQDAYELGKDFPRIAEIQLQSSPDGRRILARVANGDGGEFAFYLREPSGEWRQLTRFEDKVTQAQFGQDPLYIEAGKDDAVYLLSHENAARGKILRLPFSSRGLNDARLVLAEGNSVISDFRPTASGLALKLLRGGPSEFAYFDFFDKKLRRPPERSVSAVDEILVTQGDEILYCDETFTRPEVWWRYNPSVERPRIEATPFSRRALVDFGDVETIRETARSKDSARVPLTILRKKGTRLNGENPTILQGYGGYGISMEPRYDPARRLWLDQGGVLAFANLRGGGESGEDWHRAGSLTNKQNVFDDFAACADFLIRTRHTRPGKLAVEGRSNGGLLMGAFLTQHPDLARAVVSHVGIYDMLRVELDPNGAFNVTEFGTVRDPDQFKALFAYSPLHHVVDGTRYPAVLMLTGDHDGRVNPAHSRKMIARLQAANASSYPVLLRTSSNTGHGLGTALSERIQQLADVYSFLIDQLGLDYTLIDRGPWSGGITSNSAMIKAKLARHGLRARLVVSQSEALTGPFFSDYVIANTNRYDVTEFMLTNLAPDTQYYYGVEIDGRLDRARHGAFRTFPAAGPASFQFAFASCAHTGSTSDVFDRIRENRPLFFLQMGDFHYLDIQTNSRARFRAAYDTVLASPQQSEMYRHIPLVYMWDDHDFGGNNSNRRAPTLEAARLTYEEYVPHYPLAFPQDGALGHSFSVGRVKFIVTDLRSQRDPAPAKDTPKKTMMGEAQKEWFKQELLQSNGKYPLICWMSTVPWIGQAGTNVYKNVGTNQYGYIHHTNLMARPAPASADAGGTNKPAAPSPEDYWSVFSNERHEIADFIKTNHIQGVCILHGDSHMLAADDGSHSDYATGGGAPLPVMCAAPLDQEPSLKGGPYSQGVYRVRKGEGCFGLVTITDQGARIDVAYSGRNNKNEEKISLRFSVPAKPSASP